MIRCEEFLLRKRICVAGEKTEVSWWVHRERVEPFVDVIWEAISLAERE